MARTGPEQFRAVGLGPARFAVIVEPRGTHRHLPRRFEIHPVLGERMLDTLILSNGTVEHNAFARVLRRAAERVLSDSNRFDRDQNSFGVEAMQDVRKALAFLADAVGFGNK